MLEDITAARGKDCERRGPAASASPHWSSLRRQPKHNGRLVSTVQSCIAISRMHNHLDY